MLTPLWPYFREYWNTKTAGTYMCVCCSTPLFRFKSSLPELIPVSIFILLCFRCLFLLRVIGLCPYRLAATPYWSPLHYCLIYCVLICHHLHLIVNVFLLSFPISPLWPFFHSCVSSFFYPFLFFVNVLSCWCCDMWLIFQMYKNS
jgi:hypothetical protein